MDKVERCPLLLMRKRGGTWAAYRNEDMGHPDLGHLKFLRVGEDCTFKEAPRQMPDTSADINWRYQLVGFVDISTGEIKPLQI